MTPSLLDLIGIHPLEVYTVPYILNSLPWGRGVCNQQGEGQDSRSHYTPVWNLRECEIGEKWHYRTHNPIAAARFAASYGEYGEAHNFLAYNVPDRQDREKVNAWVTALRELSALEASTGTWVGGSHMYFNVGGGCWLGL